MRNRKKKNKTMLLLLILLGVSVGFALLSTTLKINGTAGIKSNTWDIHWENVVPNQSSTITAETPALSENNTKVTYEVELSLPGDFYEFTVDAKNDGSVNGKIDEIRHTIKEVTIVEGEEVETTATLPNYILYTIYYDGTETAPAEGDILEAGETQTYRVRLEYDRNSEVLPGTDKVYRITDEMDYVQTKDRASVVGACQTEMNQILANPNNYRNQDQSATNLDIGLDDNCNVINLDMWVVVNADYYSQEVIGTKLYYTQSTLSTIPSDIDEYNYDINVPNDETYLGMSGDLITPATSSAQIINGELQTPIPAYVLFNGESSFYPVTKIDYAFSGADGGWYEREEGHKLTVMPDLPNTVTTIGSTAFGYTPLTSVTIPQNVKTIGEAAFERVSLTSLNFESFSNLERIESRAFRYNNLTGNLVLPQSVQSIGNGAFIENDLTSVTFPSSATYFENQQYGYDNSFDSNVVINHNY